MKIQLTIRELKLVKKIAELRKEKNKLLSEMRAKVAEGKNEGCICPVCDQLAKRWEIKLHSGMASWLLLLVKKYEKNGKWISVSDFNHEAGMRGGDYAKLRHWGLIVQATNKDISKRASGFWKPTKKGIDFINELCTVPKSIWTYNKELLGFSDGDINIREALGNKFDYTELMKG